MPWLIISVLAVNRPKHGQLTFLPFGLVDERTGDFASIEA